MWEVVTEVLKGGEGRIGDAKNKKMEGKNSFLISLSQKLPPPLNPYPKIPYYSSIPPAIPSPSKTVETHLMEERLV